MMSDLSEDRVLMALEYLRGEKRRNKVKDNKEHTLLDVLAFAGQVNVTSRHTRAESLHHKRQPGYLDLLHVASNPARDAPKHDSAKSPELTRNGLPTQRDDAKSPSYLATLETVAGLRQCGGNPQDCTPPPSPPNDCVNKDESLAASQARGDVTCAVTSFLCARHANLQYCWEWAKSRSRRSQGFIFFAMAIGLVFATVAMTGFVSKTNRESGTGAAPPILDPESSTAATTRDLTMATAATKAAARVPLALGLIEAVAGVLVSSGRWVVSCGAALVVPASTQSWIVGGDTINRDHPESELHVFDDSASFQLTLVHVPEAGARVLETVGSLPHDPGAPLENDDDDCLDPDCGAHSESINESAKAHEDLDEIHESFCSVATPISSSNQREAETPSEATPTASPTQPQDDEEEEDAPSPPAPAPSSPRWRGQRDLVSVQVKREGTIIPLALRGCLVKLNHFAGWAIAELRPRARAAHKRAREFADTWNTAEAIEKTKNRLKTAVRHVIFLLCFFSV